MKNNKLIIGQAIKAKRIEKHLSMQKLGELIGFSGRTDSYIYVIESGKSYPPYDKLRAIKEVLDMDWDDLIP